MLPAARLKREADFNRVRERGRNYSNRYVALYALPNDLRHTRVGLAAGKKLGKAHIRNRIKRIMREAIRLNYARIRPGLDFLLVARAATVDQNYATIAPAVLDLLRRANLLQPEPSVLPPPSSGSATDAE